MQEEEEGVKEEEGEESRGSEAQDGEGMYNVMTTHARVYMASKDTPQAMEKLAWNWFCLAALEKTRKKVV